MRGSGACPAIRAALTLSRTHAQSRPKGALRPVSARDHEPADQELKSKKALLYEGEQAEGAGPPKRWDAERPSAETNPLRRTGAGIGPARRSRRRGRASGGAAHVDAGRAGGQYTPQGLRSGLRQALSPLVDRRIALGIVTRRAKTHRGLGSVASRARPQRGNAQSGFLGWIWRVQHEEHSGTSSRSKKQSNDMTIQIRMNMRLKSISGQREKEK